jgi:cytosine/adenosine deaminase-related metal-dependent hydrolase
MSSSLVRGRYVIARATSRAEVAVIEDGAVFQRDGRIVEIGTYADLAGRHAADEVLGGPDTVVTPGFVNAHHHQGVTPVQHGCQDLPLELWFASLMQSRDVDLYLDTLYSAFEMIESGVTTVQHLHGWMRGTPTEVCDAVERVFEGYRAVGMRVSFSYGLSDQCLLVYGDDRDFVASLPPALGRTLAQYFAETGLPMAEQFGIFEHLYQRYNGSERARVQLAPNNLHWCSDTAIEAMRGYADRYRVPMHMHLLETPYQKEYARRRTGGGSAVEHLRRHGLLGPDLTLGHGVWMTEADIETVAATGTHVCHNASSNLRLRSGIAPLNALAKRDVAVAIGMDEAGINDDRDMLQEMRLVLKLHRTPGMDDDVSTSAQVFRMATEHGATTTGFADTIGVLAPGMAADMVLLDWRSIAFPYLNLDRDISVIDAVLHRARSAGVRTVIVAGEPIYRDGRFTRVDKDAVLAELAAHMARPLGDDEQRNLALGRALMPHVRRFYDGWLDHEARDPFQRGSSRT